METNQIQLVFQDVKPNALSKNFSAVEKRLAQLAGKAIKCEPVRVSETSMDLGTTLVLTFGTPAAVALAKGLLEFLKRWPNKLIIETPNGRIEATGDAAVQAAKVNNFLGLKK